MQWPGLQRKELLAAVNMEELVRNFLEKAESRGRVEAESRGRVEAWLCRCLALAEIEEERRNVSGGTLTTEMGHQQREPVRVQHSSQKGTQGSMPPEHLGAAVEGEEECLTDYGGRSRRGQHGGRV